MTPRPGRGFTPRAFLYAGIPVGFAAMVGVFLQLGEPTGGPTGRAEDPAEDDPLATGASPLDAAPVTDPEAELTRGGTQNRDLYDDREGEVIPTPSGPEGRDDRVFFEE